MLYDNPAERLRVVLERGKRINSEYPCHNAWEELLQAKPNDGDDLYAKLGKFMALPRQVVQFLQTNFPEQLPGTEHWRSQLNMAFTRQSLSGQWTTFISHIGEQSIAQLAVTAALIQAKSATQLVADQDLEGIAAAIHELIVDVDKSDLSASLKNYVARELSELIQAIRDYRVSGAVPVLKQAEAMVGHTLLDPEYSSFLTNHELGKRLLDNLNATAALLTVALQLPQLGTAFSALLK